MNKIAIDVVLLPPPAIAKQAVAISNTLAETSGNRKIVLNENQCLPHISLCMGAVREEDISKVTAILADLSKRLPALQLKISGIKAHLIPTGEHLAVLEVDNQPLLQQLHETIMRQLRAYLSYDDVEASMFLAPPTAERISIKWVRDFNPDSSNPMVYYPHLTSGFGTYDNFDFPIEFMADTLAVCHLGNYCTCRKVLNSFKLH